MDVWKENMMDELESGEAEYESVEEFLTCLRKEFGGGEEESVKEVGYAGRDYSGGIVG